MKTGTATVNFRAFRLMEIPIFDAIVEQRNENEGEGPFVLSVKKALEMLKNNGNAAKYGIGAEQIRNTIQKFAEDGIVDADWIVKYENCDPRTYEFAHHDVGYMYQRYCGEIVINGDEECDDWMFIDITFEQIKAIKDNCAASYKSSLSYDETEKRFVVKCAQLGVAYIIKRINYGGRGAKVLRIALTESPNKPITRGELKAKGVNDVMGVSIATRVFDDNSVVRNELKPFIKNITNESITVSTIAILTLAQLKAIKKASF